MKDLNTRFTLIQRIKSDDDDTSWEEFSEIYSPYLYVVIRNMSLSHHDTEDLLQQVLLKAWKGLQTFQYEPHKHKFRSWLHTITKNTVRSFVKRHSTKMSKAGDHAKQDEMIQLNNIEAAEVEEKMIEEWNNYIANLAFDNIKDKFKPQVMKSFEMTMDGLSGKEISDELGIPVNTVYVYKNRVQSALLKEVNRLDQDLG